jgi:hypothetical protein
VPQLQGSLSASCVLFLCYLIFLHFLTFMFAMYVFHCQAPALAWDEKLAASAKAWAATCQFAVSGTPGVGEGLGFGYSSFTEAVKDWYGQVRRCCCCCCCCI